MVDASLRKAPTQNGSQSRQFIAYAQMDQKSELALRPSDRQVLQEYLAHKKQRPPRTLQ